VTLASRVDEIEMEMEMLMFGGGDQRCPAR
jgi:hypothetical protein